MSNSSSILNNTLVEQRNYLELKWQQNYQTYYQQKNSKQTNVNIKNKICKCNKKKYFIKKCNCSINWNWYLYRNKLKNIPSLRGHSVCDIGDNYITIGNKVKSNEISIYQITKDFTSFKKLKTFGAVPKQRFAHSAEYIPPINAILFFGGFDTKNNYNDARLLFLNTFEWFTLTYNTTINVRAYHTTCCRIDSNKNEFEIYIFGGQYCNGGPYEFYNDIFKFTFYNGYFECDEIPINGIDIIDIPHARAQCYSWINDNRLYIFGGCYDTSTLNDLSYLDLNIFKWIKVKYNGIINAPLTHNITPAPFRIFPARKPCYFDKILNKLIVIHDGYLSDMQSHYMKYNDCLEEFEQRNLVNPFKKNSKSMSPYSITFTFDLYSNKWDIIKIKQKKNLNHIPMEIPLSRFIRCGQYLVQMGGGQMKKQLNYIKCLYLLKIPSYRIINHVSWSRERLLWIAHYKQTAAVVDDNNKKCLFYKLPKEIMLLIVSFLNIIPKYNVINQTNGSEFSDLSDINENKENDIDFNGHNSSASDFSDINDDITNEFNQTIMGYEQNDQLLQLKIVPQSILIDNITLMNTKNAPPLKFVFDKKQHKRSPINDDNDKSITLMGCTGFNGTNNELKYDQSDCDQVKNKTKGQLLMGCTDNDLTKK